MIPIHNTALSSRLDQHAAKIISNNLISHIGIKISIYQFKIFLEHLTHLVKKYLLFSSFIDVSGSVVSRKFRWTTVFRHFEEGRV